MGLGSVPAADDAAVADDELQVVGIADGILAVIDAFRGDKPPCFGIYHLAASGSASWCEFARVIFDIAGPRLPKAPKVNAITTADYPTPAPRPADSRLDTSLFEETFGYRSPAWRVSLAETLARLT